jgi:hypothetical protein
MWIVQLGFVAVGVALIVAIVLVFFMEDLDDQQPED